MASKWAGLGGVSHSCHPPSGTARVWAVVMAPPELAFSSPQASSSSLPQEGNYPASRTGLVAISMPRAGLTRGTTRRWGDSKFPGQALPTSKDAPSLSRGQHPEFSTQPSSRPQWSRLGLPHSQEQRSQGLRASGLCGPALRAAAPAGREPGMGRHQGRQRTGQGWWGKGLRAAAAAPAAHSWVTSTAGRSPLCRVRLSPVTCWGGERKRLGSGEEACTGGAEQAAWPCHGQQRNAASGLSPGSRSLLSPNTYLYPASGLSCCWGLCPGPPGGSASEKAGQPKHTRGKASCPSMTQVPRTPGLRWRTGGR